MFVQKEKTENINDGIIWKKCDAIVNELYFNRVVEKNREMEVIYFPMQTTRWVEMVRRKWETESEQSEGLMEWVELHL